MHEPGNEEDLPRLRIVPVNLTLLGIVLGGAAGFLWPVRFAPASYARPAGLVLAGIGLTLLAFAREALHRADTPHRDTEPATALVTDGVYRWSRNPMYVAMTLFGVGMAVLLNSLWLLGIAALLAVAFHFGAVRPEERYLERRFGELYREYRRRVRRWI